MPPDFDRVFDTIKSHRPTRTVVFREAVSYSLASETVVYASDLQLPAKVLWRTDAGSLDFMQGVWQAEDEARLVIWFKDLTGNRTATNAEITDWTTRMKGQVGVTSREFYSRFVVDGRTLKTRALYPLERPDGKVYGLRIHLQAAE